MTSLSNLSFILWKYSTTLVELFAVSERKLHEMAEKKKKEKEKMKYESKYKKSSHHLPCK